MSLKYVIEGPNKYFWRLTAADIKCCHSIRAQTGKYGQSYYNFITNRLKKINQRYNNDIDHQSHTLPVIHAYTQHATSLLSQ